MKSMQVRFVVLMVAIVSLMLAGFGWMNYAHSRNRQYAQLHAHLQAIGQRLGQSLPAVLWRLDQEQIQQLAESEVNAEAIVAIAVFDEQKRLLYRTQRAHAGTGSAARIGPLALDASAQRPPTNEELQPDSAAGEFVHQFGLLAHVDGSVEPVGSVQVLVSTRAIAQFLGQEAQRLVLLVLLMNVVMVAALIGVLRLVVMRPLAAVGQALQAITAEGADLSARIAPSGWREFDALIGSFNALAQRMEFALGAPIDEVHAAISCIAQGDFSQPIASAAQAPAHTVIARLALMQRSLVALTAQLRQAKQAADAASQAKSDFLASMSHEIRTPLNAILGLTRLALRGDIPVAQRTQLGKVMQAASHLLGVINDILDFSKIEAGKLALEDVEFALDEVIDNVVTLVAERAADKRLELVTDISTEVPQRLRGDPLRLAQIVVNFASNAIKFSERGEVVLHVRVLEHQDTQVRLRIGVRDSGIGIAPAQQAQLFENFVQAHTSTTRHYGGTGLGLAIAKRLAQQMGGGVGMASEVGVGSDFWCDVVLGCLPERRAAKIARAPAALQGQRALVVDSHPTARSVMLQLLQADGLQAVGAASAAQALQLLQEGGAGSAWHWVFIDCNLPDLHGFEVAGRVQALLSSAQVQVYGMSPLAITHVPEQLAAWGVAGIFPKPAYPGAMQQFWARYAPTQAREGSALPQARPIGEDTGARHPLYGARVLLVEDIEINREVALGLLDTLGLGLVVDCAPHGQAALQLLQQHAYSAVLMDVHMPVMDGWQATEAIRRNPLWAQLPIIAMTANSMESDVQRCKAVGMNDFVGKPIDPAQLQAVLLRWLLPIPQAPQPPGRAVESAVPQALSAPPKPKPLLEALQHVPGLDAASGLQAFGNKQATYREMLRRFVVDYETGAAAIGAAWQAGDGERAAMRAQLLAEAAERLGVHEAAGHAHAVATLAQAAASAASAESEVDGGLQRSDTVASDSVAARVQALDVSLQRACSGVRQALPQLFT